MFELIGYSNLNFERLIKIAGKDFTTSLSFRAGSLASRLEKLEKFNSQLNARDFFVVQAAFNLTDREWPEQLLRPVVISRLYLVEINQVYFGSGSVNSWTSFYHCIRTLLPALSYNMNQCFQNEGVHLVPT